MQRELFEVKRERFHLLDPDIYILQGSWPKDYEPDVWLDNEPVVEVTLEDWENTSALERFTDLDMMRGKKVTMSLRLPPLKNRKKLKIFAVNGDERILWFSISAADLQKRQGKPFYYIEEEKASPSSQTLKVRGWVAWKEPAVIRVYDENGKRIPCEIQRNNRVDVAEMFRETQIDPKCGFYLELSDVKTKVVYLVFRATDTKAVYPVNMQRSMILARKAGRLLKKGRRYMASHGVKALLVKTAGKIAGLRKAPVSYDKWLPKHLPTAAQLARQREMEFAVHPKISIVVPLYRTPKPYLAQLIQSVKDQTYTNWEICLSDGSGGDSPLKETLQRYQKEDERIRVVFHQESLKIAENTNAAIEAATGEWIAFADHDDVLTPDALFCCVKELNEQPQTEIIYSDEDKMSMDGNKFFQPHFKPDYNPDLLCTVNYICHLLVVKRSVIERAGMMRPEYDGAQDYDFIFRCVETSQNIRHIPRILYHWRSHESSTSENPESKLYAFEAGARAVQAH